MCAFPTKAGLRKASEVSALFAATALALLPLAAHGQTVIVPDTGAVRGLGTTVGQSGAVFTIDGGSAAGANLFHSFAEFSLGQGDTARWTRAADPAAVRNVINRVTGGKASQIAGTLDSTDLPNASFFFLNPAGVVFTAGARVNVPGAAYFSSASDLRLSDGVRFASNPTNGSTLSMASPQSFGFVGGEQPVAVSGVGETFAPSAASLFLIASGIDIFDSVFTLKGLDLSAVNDGAVRIGGSQVVVSADGSSSGGLRISGGEITIANAKLISHTGSDVRGGDIALSANVITLRDATLLSNVGTAGVGANIDIFADDFLAVRADLIAQSPGSGARGAITLDARLLELADSRVVARSVSLLGEHLVVSTTQLIAEARADLAEPIGLVRLAATGNIELFRSFITSSTAGAAPGGDVSIRGQDVSLDSSQVLSETYGAGDAGGVSVKADRLLMQFGEISSNSYGAGRAGEVSLDARGIVLANTASVTSDTFGDGDAGGVTVTAGEVKVADNASITSETSFGTGHAGAVTIVSDSLNVSNGFISSDTEGRGDAGAVNIRTGTLLVTNPDGAGAYISSDSLGDGRAGDVIIEAKSVTIRDQGFVSSTAFERGDAGSVILQAGTLLIDNGLISSAADLGSRGASGNLHLEADVFTVQNGGRISTGAFSQKAAGTISLAAATLVLNGAGSLVSSENFAGGPAAGALGGPVGDAGSVSVTAENLTISNGARITTNSFGGAAGDISIGVPRPGLLILEGADAVGSIQTSSGAGTGGRITIADPLAIVSNGGAILALGQLSGANVNIRSRYFINSTDRPNTVAVDGDVRLETGLYDVSSGTVNRELSVLDASKVLQGQCPAARSTGVVSQLIARPVGPYVRDTRAGRDGVPTIAPAGVKGICR